MKTRAKLSEGIDHGLKGRYTGSCIIFSQHEKGIEVTPDFFFNEKGIKKLKAGKKLFLFSFDIGYRECLVKYLALYN